MKLRFAFLPAALFLLYAGLLGGWIVDDAGISLAYARNLATGHGLVSQPGVPPVEGYSNPMWVLLLAFGFLLTPLSPLVLVKLIAAALIILTFVVYLTVLSEKLTNGEFIALLGLCLVSIQTSIVIWCASGLENPLTLLLTGMLLSALVSSVPDSDRAAGLAGCSVAMLALTRPEGIIYAWLYPATLLRSDTPRRRRAFWNYLASILFLILPYFVLRLLYFRRLLPNPYYAKGGPSIETVLTLLTLHRSVLHRVTDLGQDLVGRRMAPALILAVIGISLWGWTRKGWTWTHSVLALMTMTALAGYLLLPADWMPAHRYASVVFFDGTLFSLALAFGGVFSLPSACSPVWRAAVGVTAMLSIGTYNLPRMLEFREDPTISVWEVRARAQRLEGIATILGLGKASWLTPDVGGALLYSRMRIFDLGMLCDARIAQTLGEGSVRDIDGFHEYLFGEIKPTFVTVRAYHTWIAQLELDRRFRRDYLPIREFPDDWIESRFGKVVMSGEFVRKSALVSGRDSLGTVRSYWKAHPSPWDR
jgi:hypothetical protein